MDHSTHQTQTQHNVASPQDLSPRRIFLTPTSDWRRHCVAATGHHHDTFHGVRTREHFSLIHRTPSVCEGGVGVCEKCRTCEGYVCVLVRSVYVWRVCTCRVCVCVWCIHIQPYMMGYNYVYAYCTLGGGGLIKAISIQLVNDVMHAHAHDTVTDIHVHDCIKHMYIATHTCTSVYYTVAVSHTVQ